ncbi:MAG: hypothetical protein IJL63_06870 [Clostridia bacterium]|nr:hypothetical protein [Clostridia bacterium]
MEYGYYATLYRSEFSGKFKNPKKVNHYTYSFEVEKITYNQTPGTEEIKLYPGTDQNARYVYTEAEGLDGTGIIYAYTSAAPLSKLPTEFKDFLFINNNSGALSFRGLYSFDSEYHYGWRE